MSTRLSARRSAVSALIGAFLLSIIPALPVAANSTAQPLPFTQDWTNTDLITTNDDWSGVPGVVGFLGQDITTGTGTDPQTLLTDSLVANDVDVIANLPEGNFTNGGVGEFHGPTFTNPVVALQGNGTADAPHIVLDLDTTGWFDVSIAYVLRDIDDTLDNAVQPVALQYRVGSSGTWTNVPAGFVADATTGPGLATLVTPVNVTLPSAVNDRPLVQVRIITANAVGADEWVGIDDISVTGSAIDLAPVVQSTTPSDGAADVAVGSDISVTFSEPVNATAASFTIACAGSGTHSAAVSGGPTTFTLDPAVDFASSENCTVTVLAAGVTDQDANDPPDEMAVDHVFGFMTAAASSPPTVDAGGPYAVVEGGSVSVAATGSEPDGQALTYAWDLDGDGTFETPGQSATFSAAGLHAPGTRSIAVRATGPTGPFAIDEATIDVTWDFGGFKPPTTEPPAVNELKAGHHITLTFSLGGNQGLAIFRPDYPASAQYACGSLPPTVANEPASGHAAKPFGYDAGRGEYSFDWDTQKAWKDTCRVFVLGLRDGTTHNIAFRFR